MEKLGKTKRKLQKMNRTVYGNCYLLGVSEGVLVFKF